MVDALSRQADDSRAQTAHGETVVSSLRDSQRKPASACATR